MGSNESVMSAAESAASINTNPILDSKDNPPSTKYIDLHLPSDKLPTQPKNNNNTTFDNAISTLFQNRYSRLGDKKQHNLLQKKALFSVAVGSKEDIYFNNADLGLFGTILEAWANHLNIRTSPEDWWLPVITRVARLVDERADTKALRDYFVRGRQGKEEIVVQFPSFSIYDTDYNYVFKEYSQQINKKIAVKGYVEALSSSFSTTTPDQLIGSQITLMSSFQKYFDYRLEIFGCGIKGLEMIGKEEDWRLLRKKLTKLRELLAPIESTLNIASYFNEVETIYDNLLKTYLGHNMDHWWSKILIDCKDIEYGPSGIDQFEVDSYNGWIVFFCNGIDSPLKAEDLERGEYKELSCLSSCPMKIVDIIRKIEDRSILMAGILGYKLYNDNPNGVPSLQAAHGWALLLPSNSPLR